MLRPETRETITAYGLGAVGLVVGIAKVYAIEPLAAFVQEHRELTPIEEASLGLHAVSGQTESMITDLGERRGQATKAAVQMTEIAA